MQLDTENSTDGLFCHHAALKKLERQLLAHVRELGDLRDLSGLEQVVYSVLADEIDETLALDLSRILVARAVERVIHDPMRDITDVPHGISRAERFAAFFEQGCPFCEAKIGLEHEREDVEDDCECCAMLVSEWRARHAEALRNFKRPRAPRH